MTNMKSFNEWLKEATISFPNFMQFNTNAAGTGGKFSFQKIPDDPLDAMKSKLNYLQSIYEDSINKFNDQDLDYMIEELPTLYHTDAFTWNETLDALIKELNVKHATTTNTSNDQNKKQEVIHLLSKTIAEAEKFIQDHTPINFGKYNPMNPRKIDTSREIERQRQ